MRASREIAPNLFHESGLTLDRIPETAIVAITRVRNEGWRLPFWLAYHRWLGVDHFVIVDNRSTDQTREILAAEPDVTLLYAPGDYQGPGGWESWIGFVQAAAPRNRWNLLLDADELFVVTPWRKGGLREAARSSEHEDIAVVPAVLVDCYPGTIPLSGSDFSVVPWERAPWFDAGPYVMWSTRRRRPSPVYHGVRERMFWPSWRWQRHIPKLVRKRLGISSPPAIMKAPFFRDSAARGLASHRSAHSPRHRAKFPNFVLHYKLDADFAEKTQNAVEEGQYYLNSIEYRAYQRSLAEGRLELKNDRSRKFAGLQSLIKGRLYVTRRSDSKEVSVSDSDCDIDTAWREIRKFGGNSLTATISLPRNIG